MSEGVMWGRIKDDLARVDIHMERIENSAGDGHPDVHLCYRGKDIYWELKAPDIPVRETSILPVEIRRSQLSWFADRHRKGKGRAWIVVRVKRHIAAFSNPQDIVELYYQRKTVADVLNDAEFLCTDYRQLLRHCYETIENRESVGGLH